jgi:hypothetical protein
MKKLISVACTVCIAIALTASCATAPKVPDWVLSIPAADGMNTYFVGSSSGPDVGTATADATSNMIAGIMQYMGVSVKVSTSATAKASLDAYSADIRQTVETQSTNRLAGFQVKQKFMQTDKATGKITVHILASYATAELNKERARIAALFQEKADAVAKPEADGDNLVSQGRVLDAINRYMEAMVAASGSDIENADIKLERNANKARAQIASLGFSTNAGQGFSGILGTVPSLPLEIRLFADNGGVKSSVPGAALNVTYPRKLANGKIGSKSQNLVTDTNGAAKLTLPAPDFVGKGKISVQLDLSSALDLLDKLGSKHDALRSAIEDEITSKTAEIQYVVASAARTTPTALFITDLDEKGYFTGLGVAQSGLLESLTKEGFSVLALALDPTLAVSGSGDQILAAARKAAPQTMKRIIYGVCKIESVRKDGALFIVSASGSLKAVDLASGQILYATDKTWQAIGSDEAVARRNALRELGSKVFGAEIISSLP